MDDATLLKRHAKRIKELEKDIKVKIKLNNLIFVIKYFLFLQGCWFSERKESRSRKRG